MLHKSVGKALQDDDRYMSTSITTSQYLCFTNQGSKSRMQATGGVGVTHCLLCHFIDLSPKIYNRVNIRTPAAVPRTPPPPPPYTHLTPHLAPHNAHIYSVLFSFQGTSENNFLVCSSSCTSSSTPPHFTLTASPHPTTCTHG